MYDFQTNLRCFRLFQGVLKLPSSVIFGETSPPTGLPPEKASAEIMEVLKLRVATTSSRTTPLHRSVDPSL